MIRFRAVSLAFYYFFIKLISDCIGAARHVDHTNLKSFQKKMTADTSEVENEM
jgi:hypothetical protein